MQLNRREWLTGMGAGAALASLSVSPAQAIFQSATSSLPPPITREERLARLAKARALMAENDIGAIVVESGPSLVYFTGVRWGRSERFTGAVIPVNGGMYM